LFTATAWGRCLNLYIKTTRCSRCMPSHELQKEHWVESCSTDGISRQKIGEMLNQLLLTYTDEVTAGEQLYLESQRDGIKRYARKAKEADRLYWESARDTILDVAVTLNIALDVKHHS